MRLALQELLEGRIILVTGAAGFIGSNLTLRLLKTGARVIGLDNLNDYYDPRLKKYRLGLIEDAAKSSRTRRNHRAAYGNSYVAIWRTGRLLRRCFGRRHCQSS